MSPVLRESEALSSHEAPTPWLSLVGLGEDGASGLCREALAALNEAEIVFGGDRHIALVGSVPGELRPWPQPFRNALPQILRERGRKVCVLATSDPFHYGIGNSISRAIPAEEMRIIPQLSSFSMACTRMRWPQEECALVSLHGLGVGWVSILDPDGITEVLKAPPDWKLVAYLCVGWPEEDCDVPELVTAGWERG